MKYIAVRVSRNINGQYTIQGQKNTDYNWENLGGCSGEFDTHEQACEGALIIGKNLSNAYHNFITVYSNGGYGIGKFYKGKKI